MTQDRGRQDRESMRSRRGLTYLRRGVGSPVLLIHGWCLSHVMWTYLEDRLVTAGHQVVIPDLAGFGSSADLAGPYDLARHGADTTDLLDELELDHAILVGFAFGGAVLMSLPSYARISGLVLIGVPSASAAPYRRMPAAMRRDWPEFARRSAVSICGTPKSEATLSWLARMFETTRLSVALETVGVLAGFEPAQVAASISVPALLVHGVQDPVVPLAVSEGCATLMPNGRVVPVEESGHLVVLDQPDALAEIVTGFSAEVLG
jgi:pimeloyl-ACP methyl ester carboxylesterase